ncbi:MAG: alpha/beta hydrolase [Oscillospiraceae bacterium]|nr:alpha/beta hydrolase [Oscillospiraceae bacterium]
MNINCADMGSGSVVLFLHGWGAPASLYMPILKHLSKSFRVIAPDLPGFGGTDEPDDVWGTEDYVNFVQELLREKGITECMLIGHSHGGRMILNWLSRDEQPIKVTKAVLCAAAGLKPPRGRKYYIKVYTFKLIKLLLKPFPKLLEGYSGMVGSADYKAATPKMRQVLTKVVNEDYIDALPKITQPALLVWGDMDTATPIEHARTMERLIPNAGIVTLKGGSHFAVLEQIPLFLRVLEVFLKG